MAVGDHSDDSFIDMAKDLATWQTAGTEERSEAVQAVWDICRDVCPVQHRCVGMRCNYYQVEQVIKGLDAEDDE